MATPAPLLPPAEDLPWPEVEVNLEREGELIRPGERWTTAMVGAFGPEMVVSGCTIASRCTQIGWPFRSRVRM